MATTLTQDQVTALEAAGREVAEEWLRQGDEPAGDYDFSETGDWQHVRAAARAAGIEWGGIQPPAELRAEVWEAALRGYRSAIE